MARFTLPIAFSPSLRLGRSEVHALIASPAAIEVPLDPIAIFWADAVVEGWTERSTTRPSDKLNGGLPIDVRYAPDGPAHLMETDDVIAVAVQTHPDPSPKRIARRRHVLEMRAGSYEIRGVVHMPPGADPRRYVRATSQRWLAVTKATVVDGDNGEAYEIGALLVNMEHITRT